MAEAILKRFAESDEYTDLQGSLLCIDGYLEITAEERTYLMSIGFS